MPESQPLGLGRRALTVAPRRRAFRSPVTGARPARRARSLTLHRLWTSTCYQLTLDPGAKTSSLCLTLSIHSCPHGAHGRELPVSSNPCRSRRSRHSRQTHAGLVVLVGLVGLVILVRPMPVSSFSSVSSVSSFSSDPCRSRRAVSPLSLAREPKASLHIAHAAAATAAAATAAAAAAAAATAAAATAAAATAAAATAAAATACTAAAAAACPVAADPFAGS
jgi:hypothetical protein